MAKRARRSAWGYSTEGASACTVAVSGVALNVRRIVVVVHGCSMNQQRQTVLTTFFSGANLSF